MGDREDASHELADYLAGFDRAEDTAIQAVTTVITTDEKLCFAECHIQVVVGRRYGAVFAVGKRSVRLETVRVRRVIYRDDAILDDDMIARQAYDTFDELFSVLGIAVVRQSAFGQDNDIPPLRDILMSGDLCPGAGQLPYDQPIVIMEGVLHARSIYLV